MPGTPGGTSAAPSSREQRRLEDTHHEESWAYSPQPDIEDSRRRRRRGHLGATVNVLGVVQIRHAQAQTARIVAQQGAVSNALVDLQNTLWGARNNVSVLGAYPESMRADRMTKVKDSFAAFEASFLAFQQVYKDQFGADPAGVEDLNAAWAAYVDNLENVLLPYAMRGDFENFAKVRDSSSAEAGATLVKSITVFTDGVNSELRASSDGVAADATRSALMLAGLMVIGVVGAAVVGVLVAHRIRRSVRSVRPRSPLSPITT